MRHIPTILATLLIGASLFGGEGGTLKGSVKYEGEAPAPVNVKVDPVKNKECAHCNAVDESWVVDPATKGLKWAVVRIMDVKADAVDGKKLPPLKIDQKGCVFAPHVAIVTPDQSVEVLNPDDITHNFHTTPLNGDNMGINRAISKGVPSMAFKGSYFSTPEVIKVTCDYHPWMVSYIVVHDPRFVAVTGADGTFEIKNVPPGKYKVIVTHGTTDREKEIEIKDGATATLDTTYKQK